MSVNANVMYSRDKIRRVNFFGGPCSGKSTVAAWLFSELKRKHYETDWVQESIKQWTYLDRNPDKYSDQLRIFTNQVELESTALRKLQVVVCDAPLLMNCYYGWKYNCKFAKNCIDIALEFEEDYPSLNIFLMRGDLPYSSIGRYQTQEEALAMDVDVQKFLRTTMYGKKLHMISTTNREGLLDLVTSSL